VSLDFGFLNTDLFLEESVFLLCLLECLLDFVLALLALVLCKLSLELSDQLLVCTFDLQEFLELALDELDLLEGLLDGSLLELLVRQADEFLALSKVVALLDDVLESRHLRLVLLDLLDGLVLEFLECLHFLEVLSSLVLRDALLQYCKFLFSLFNDFLGLKSFLNYFLELSFENLLSFSLRCTSV